MNRLAHAATSLRTRARSILHDAASLDVRTELAHRYLRGDGLEIGALHAPLTVPRAARVQYVDRMTREDLRRHYPELRDLPLVDVSVIENGESLRTVRSHSVGFVVANHVLEHCENTLATLDAWLRVVNDRGIVYLSVPDKRLCFDAERPVTTLAHVVDEWKNGPERNRRAHFLEWVTHVERTPPAEREARADELMREDYSIHFHAFSWAELTEVLLFARRELSSRFEVEALQCNGLEVIAVLRKIV